MIDKELVPFVADLLMGAAYADERLRGQEALTIRRTLAALVGGPRIPKELERRLATFDPTGFDVDLTVAAMPKLSPEAARRVLELVAAVNNADGELDLEEDRYLQRVATALGLPRREWSDLTLDVESGHDEEARPSRKPPPVPKG